MTGLGCFFVIALFDSVDEADLAPVFDVGKTFSSLFSEKTWKSLRIPLTGIRPGKQLKTGIRTKVNLYQ